MIPPRSRILEIGCSTGYLTRHLAQHLCCQVVAVESDPAAAELARPEATALLVGDIESPEILGQVCERQYDVILLAAVLEHLRRPDIVLSRIAQELAPNGRVIISLPNVAHWSVRWGLMRGKFQYEDTGLLDRTHLHLFTRKTARELIAECGLHVEAERVTSMPPCMRLFQHLPRVASLTGRLAPSLVGYELIYQAARASS